MPDCRQRIEAILRVALDELMRAKADDQDLFYFPSYELTRIFDRPFMEDRRHVHKHVIDFNMAVFERYYCKTGLSDEAVLERFQHARRLDHKVISEGHWAVERASNLAKLRRSDRPGR